MSQKMVVSCNSCSEDECNSANDTHLSVSSEPIAYNEQMLHPSNRNVRQIEKGLWNSEPSNLNPQNVRKTRRKSATANLLLENNMLVTIDGPSKSQFQNDNAELSYEILEILSRQESGDIGETLFSLSENPETCPMMRQSGCIPLLVQLMQSNNEPEFRNRALQCLHNLISAQPDERSIKRELRILKLLEQVRVYTENLLSNFNNGQNVLLDNTGNGQHPIQTVVHLMKFSFDNDQAQLICNFGGIHVFANLIEAEHFCHESISDKLQCIILHRYACTILINITFGDGNNKALLCSYRKFMRALVVQLQDQNEELKQVSASVLGNLSWHADPASRDVLREVGTVAGLMKAAMLTTKESTLKSILNALWNLSAHSTENKAEICAIEGALSFLVNTLSHKTPSIVENSGGILRNVSSQVAVREDYREILRKEDCLRILLQQLKSSNTTVVNNACGTLWSLSSKCLADQEALLKMDAMEALQSLLNSKHMMIALNSKATLQNLSNVARVKVESPTLAVLIRQKQKQISADVDGKIAEAVDDGFPTEAKYNKTALFNNYYKFVGPSLCNQFQQLSIAKPSTSRQMNTNVTKTPKPYLPCAKSSILKSPRYIPLRNKFSDCSYEDEINGTEQPIDYSRKYAEMKLPNNVSTEYTSSKDGMMKEDKGFSVYAETDLDQPTNYSLQYAEDDSDSDICDKMSKNEGAEFLQDTVKTYCTEGTPYQTPFNFSTATSMSDLRGEEMEKHIDNGDRNDESGEKKEGLKEFQQNKSRQEVNPDDKIPKSEFSSGLMSPEKPVNYCEEGTPGYFSRVSSFGSLNSIPQNEGVKAEPVEETENVENRVCGPTEMKVNKDGVAHEVSVKMVKFEQVLNYAEETPLMFSRSSSLASLDSIEQHSIHDDRSSVISDFSRLTSGIISPSELPDSPTQTVPPSPKSRKSFTVFPPSPSRIPPVEHTFQTAPIMSQKPNVFEDNVRKFKEENTPVQFSRATSLSSLTIDDQDEPADQSNEQVDQTQEINRQDDSDEPKDCDQLNVSSENEGEKNITSVDRNSENELNEDALIVSGDEEEDEAILAACIKMGMQGSRYRDQNSPIDLLTNSINLKYQTKTEYRSSSSLTNSTLLQEANSTSGVRQMEESKLNDNLSDEGSILSEEEYKILAEGIQTGMNKTKKCATGEEVKKAHRTCRHRHTSHQNLKTCSSKCSKENCHHFRKSGSLDSCFTNNINELSLQDYKALSECFRIGMSMANCYGNGSVTEPVTTSVESPKGPSENEDIMKTSEASRKGGFLGMYAKDELASYEVENSPYHFSLRSSLSDLTVDGSIAGIKSQVTSNVAPSGERKTTAPPPSPKPRNTESSFQANSASALKKDNISNNRSTSVQPPVCNQDTEQEKNDSDESKLELHTVSEDEDQDDDILAACIRLGMQKNRYCASEITTIINKLSSPKITRGLHKVNQNSDLQAGVTNKAFQGDVPKSVPLKQRTVYVEQPLIGCLQSSPPNKLTFRIKQKRAMKAKKGKHALGDEHERMIQGETDAKGFSSDCRNDFCHQSNNYGSTRNAHHGEDLQGSSKAANCTTFFYNSDRFLNDVYSHKMSDSGPSSLPTEKSHRQCGLSRQESLSSLSLESFGLDDNEQALLEQCILSGMPKNKSHATEDRTDNSAKTNDTNTTTKGKQDKRKSKRALVESMGRAVVDLLKLRKS